MATKKQLEPVAPAADKKKALAAALGQIESSAKARLCVWAKTPA